MVKFVKKFLVVAVALSLSACVTQNFENDSPVVENTASNNELAMTRISLGLGYLKMGNNSQAKFNLEKAKRFAPNMVEVYAAFAHYYETVEEPELAIEAFEKALNINSSDANTLNNYGVFLCRQDKFEASEKQFLKAISVPSYLLVSESYENLASCQIDAGKFDKAQIYLSKAIAHSPSSASALAQMVRLEYAMGNYKKARLYELKFEKVTRRFKADSLALALKVYKKLGDHKVSRNYGAMLVKMYPDSWEAQQYILNGLQRIEADELADKYQKIQAKNSANKPKKRVVLLSPKNRKNKTTNKPQQQKVVETPKTAVKEDLISAPLPIAADVATLTAAPTIVTPLVSTASVAIANVEEKDIEQQDAEQIPDPTTELDQSTVDPTDVINVDNDHAGALIAAAVVEEQLDDNVEAAITEEEIGDVVEQAAEQSTEEVTEEAIEEVTEEVTEENPTDIFDEEQAEHIPTEQIPTEQEPTQVIVAEKLAEIPFHIVEKGDNLFVISVKYNIHIQALKRWNDMGDSSRIKIGDKIILVDPEVELNAND